ncbi:MAG: alpha/beta fold hydrolase [Acidimicrobiales bacterium]
MGGVVLCPPLAGEKSRAHFTYRLLAENLAERGLTVLRFDYDGTGDSAGDDDDPDRMEAWLGSIATAVTYLRRCGVRSLGLVGMRIGALLAATVARRIGGLDALVLWDPCWSGRSFFRQQHAMSVMRFGSVLHPDGAMELPGYLCSAQTVGQISALRLPLGGQPLARRILVLTRPDRACPEEAVTGLSRHDVVWREAEGQANLFDVEASLQQVPTGTIAGITSWLAGSVAGPRHRVTLYSKAEAVFGSPSTMIERLVHLGPVGLFGIETAPVTRTVGPTVLFLNCGKDWHVGPNRMWTNLARRWAASGFRTVRFDLSGLGDSPARAGRSFQSIYSPDAFDDLTDVVAAVSPENPSDVIFAGLCSGAYQGLESAMTMAPRGVIAINPSLRFTPAETGNGPLDPRRRICRPPSRMVRMYRELPFPSLRTRLRPVGTRMINLTARRQSPISCLQELASNGVDTFIVGGADEVGPFCKGKAPERTSLLTTGRVRIEVIEGLDHALLLAQDRAQIAAMVTRHVLDRFGSIPIGVGGETAESIEVSAGRW